MKIMSSRQIILMLSVGLLVVHRHGVMGNTSDISDVGPSDRSDETLVSMPEGKTSLSWRDSNGTIRLGIDGRGAIEKLNRRLSFSVPVDEYFGIRKARFYRYMSDIVIAYEFSDGESSTGRLARVDGKAGRLNWKADIGGFNVGDVLITSSAAYVTAIGFVGRIDLQYGTYTWKHEGLYEPHSAQNPGGAYTAFLTPRLENGLVIFPEMPTGPSATRRAQRQIRIEIESGKVISK